MTFDKAINQFFDLKTNRIYAKYDDGTKYLFGICRRDSSPEDVLDPWYTIDKNTKKIQGFVVYENVDEFKNALKHPVKEFL